MWITWNVHINSYFGILILWLLYIHSIDCVYWRPASIQSLIRSRRQTNSNCKDNEFTCKDGSCIEDSSECDGKNDCKDGSDETTECKNFPLCYANFGFRCDYGACVSQKAKCNGIKECKDASDEKDCPSVNPNPTNTKCGLDKFTCNSGYCIADTQVCDGHADCPDNSDETHKECSSFTCVNAYRCNYGGCVVKNARCNGITECFDGSDEQGCASTPGSGTKKPPTPTPTPPVTPSPKPAQDGSCIVPKVPANGVFINSNNPSGSFKPGDRIPNFNALITKCNKRYKTTPPDKSYPICLNGKWTAPPLECARYCTLSNASKTSKITCKFGSIPLDSCSEPVDGTIASVKCEHLYESQSGYPNTYLCKDGSWDYSVAECRPICGEKTPKGKPNIIKGKNVTQGDYPWHIGIYANNEQKTHLCGGSILNQVVILSAAHCFTDNEGKLLPTENYLIAAGKYYRPYADDRDETAQYSTIKAIHKPDRYKGPIGQYEADIAVVILTNPLSITLAVQPVCIDWNTEFEYQQLVEGNMGVVVGWGYTVKGELPSLILKELSVPYISYDQCYEQVPRDFRRFLTYDKVCAGFLSQGTAVCQGDSGGGLTFARKYNDRYYIRGVVSTSPVSDDSCDPDQYATYTLISKHIDFIKDIEIINRI